MAKTKSIEITGVLHGLNFKMVLEPDEKERGITVLQNSINYLTGLGATGMVSEAPTPLPAPTPIRQEQPVAQAQAQGVPFLDSCPKCEHPLEEKRGTNKQSGRSWHAKFCSNRKCDYKEWLKAS